MTLAQGIGLSFACLFLMVSTWTALKLLRMAYRTRQSPELLIGIGLVGTGPLGFGMSFLAEFADASDPGLGAILRLVATFAVSVACLSFAVFTQIVFRSGKAWARTLVAITGVALVGLIFATLQDHWQLGPDRSDPAMLGRAAILSFVWGWMGIECIRYRAVLRRRLAIGLADPIVVNRFTLWAFVSIESVVLNSISTALSFMAGGSAMNTDVLVATTGVLGMTGAAAIYLAFVPPQRYARWVAQSSPSLT